MWASAWKNVNVVIEGAGMLLSLGAIKSPKSIEKIQPKVIYSNMVWPATNYNIIAWSDTKCDYL